MSRRSFRAWLWEHKIDPDAVPRLTFDTPISSHSDPAFRAWGERIDNLPRQDAHWRDQTMRRAIWGMAGDVFKHHRRESATLRREARCCLTLLRRAWAAHSVGRADLARAEFASARDAWLAYSRGLIEREAISVTLARAKGGRRMAVKKAGRGARIMQIAQTLLDAGSPRRGLAKRIHFEWKGHGWKRIDGAAPSQRTINDHLTTQGL